MDKSYPAIARKYARDVLSGKIPACEWVKKACQRQVDDLARKDWEYRFDGKKAARVCKFIEMLPHIKGEWALHRETITLQPFQVFILTTVFGWVSRETNLRRFRTAYIEMARKNGKSTFSSGVALYCLVADNEPGAEVYSAATTRDQAKIVWQDGKAMVARSPGLRTAFGVATTAHSVVRTDDPASRFQALCAEGETLDGLNIHCAIVDELHAHPTRRVFDVITSALGSRRQPLVWNITTAGSNRSRICYEIRGYATKILDRLADNDTFFGIIYTLDNDDDWLDESLWIKSNPNLGISVKLDFLQSECSKAKTLPSAQNNFLTKHMSIWVNADIALISSVAWNKGANPNLDPNDFKEELCWVGLDFAPRHDFAARVLLFRREEEDGTHYYAFVRHWLSEAEVEESTNTQYQGWALKGFITTNPGNQTDYRNIADDVVSLAEEGFRIQEVVCDPAAAQGTQIDINERTGITCVDLLPNVKNFSEPTKKLEALVADGKFHHTGDPVLAWEISNIVGHYERKGTLFPTKENYANKIDGAIAIIIALNRAMVGETKPKSIYDDPYNSEPIWIDV